MINVSNSFKEELNNDNRDYMCYVDIVLVNPGDVVESYLQDSSGEYILDSSGENINTFFDGVVISLTNENLWSNALSIEESVSNQNSFDVGSVIINKATIVINNIYEDYTSYDFTGAKVTIRIGLQLSNGTIEVVNKGIFYVDSATYNGSLITLECLDSMSKFDKDYSESELIYPATLRQIVQDACSVCGVLYSASIFENDTFIVNERPSDESLTFRQMLNYVGQIACQQFSIDHNDRLIARWYDRDMMDDLYSSPSSVDDSEYHQISSINSQNINQDDVIITGVKVTEFSEDTENPGGSYLSGTTGYVIEIKDNKLIPIGKGSGVSTYLGQKLVGMRFRPMELTFQNDPTIEPTDIAEVIDFKGNHFYTFITSTNFTVGNTQTLSCGAESPTRNSASRYSAATQAYTNSKKLVEKEKTERELAVEALNNALSNASGMYTTEERQSDGSVITYLHDKPTLEESQNVIMITAEAIGISNDGGETYPYGLFLTGDLIARLLYVVGINADYINSGAITVADNDGEITFFADTETGRVDIKAYSLTITGKTVEEIANEESETVLNDFVGSVYTPTITNLQNQIDGQIETWFYNYIPTAENYPASEWTTDTEKDKHLGDLFYVVDNAEYGGQAYRWAKIGTDYLWDYVEDTAVVKALADAATAKDTADQKRRVFVTTPYPPYDVGDLWVGDDTSDMMRCQVSRQSGNYVSTDWIKAVKYTDDTELYNFIQTDYTETIQEIYDSVDQKSETWYQSEDPSLNWTEKENVSLSDVSSDVILDVSGEEITTIFESEKSKHDGDLWKDSDTNVEYIYKDGVWIEMPIPDDVFDKIDGKAQIFVTQPVPPYSIGDLWFNSDTSDIMTCINSRDNGSYNEGDWQKRNKYTDDTYAEQVENNLNNFSEAVTEDMDNLQTQIDGKIETWYYEHEPTLENEPASGWTTDAEKQKHIGDLFYRQSNGHSYRFMKTGEDEFEWTLIQDSDIQNALTTANNAQDTADNKRRVFVTTPVPPYDIGDLWVQGANGDIMRCATARVSGDYNSEDWEKASKYTDDTAVEELDESLNQQEVFDRLTNGGTAQGIYMENGQLYILFSYAKGGVLQLGGLENEFGELSLLDDSKNKLVSLSNNGMVIYSADSAKQIGTIGVNRASDGREFISTEIFPESSGIEWTRINRNGEKRTLFRYNSSEEKEKEKIDLYMPFSVSRNNWNSGWDFLPVISSNVGNLSIRERKTSHNGLFCIKLNETGYTDGFRDLNWFTVSENSENYPGMGFLQIYPGFMRIEDLYESDALILGNDINMNRHQILNQSDERVKNNITEYNESAIEIINEIGIYEYDWIESGIHEDAGFIAQQLESIIPNAVKINKLGESYSVLPIKIIPYLVKSVQELSKEIELLKKEICELKGETYIPKESKKDKWKPSDMSLEEKREFIKSLKRAERRE